MSDAPRKLATIVALDVAGYSALTEEKREPKVHVGISVGGKARA